jgi:hypothetical protein
MGRSAWHDSIRRENEARVLRAGWAAYARTGRPPSLGQLKAESRLGHNTVRLVRSSLVGRREWPWPVPPSGDWNPRDRRGLTARQRLWLDALASQGDAVSLADASRRVGAPWQEAQRNYRLLLARGFTLGPLAHHRPSLAERRDRRAPGQDPRPPGRSAILREMNRIRAERGLPPLPAAS